MEGEKRTSVNAHQEARGDAWLKNCPNPPESVGEHGWLTQ